MLLTCSNVFGQQETRCTIQMKLNDRRLVETAEVEGGWIYRVTADSTLFVREGPGTRYPIIGELCRGELVVGREGVNGWELVIAPVSRLSGYVAGGWLKRVD